jgi:predicted ester cyclase
MIDESDPEIKLVKTFFDDLGRTDRDKEIYELVEDKNAKVEISAPAFKDLDTVYKLHESMKKMRRCLPDFKFEYDAIFKNKTGDMVFTLRRLTATHHGDAFMGIEPTGKHAKWVDMECVYLKNGKISKIVHACDQLSTFEQLGWNSLIK